MSTDLPSRPAFSKVRVAHGFVFLSGELALRDDGSLPDGIEAQTERVFERIGATLASQGLGLVDVIQVAVHLVDGADLARFNAVYLRHFADPLPVRTTVVAQLVVPGALVEITVVAAAQGS